MEEENKDSKLNDDSSSEKVEETSKEVKEELAKSNESPKINESKKEDIVKNNLDDPEEAEAVVVQKGSYIPYLISIIAVLGLVFFLVYSGSLGGNDFSNVNSKVISESANSGDVQVVKLSVSGGNYVLEPSTIKKGVPVRIEADIDKMPGCSRSVAIPAFNIRKSLISGKNVIELTPDKAGTFNIMCSMNMYRGTFTVLDSDGTKASYVEAAPTGGHTCGGAGGGCGGCGG